MASSEVSTNSSLSFFAPSMPASFTNVKLRILSDVLAEDLRRADDVEHIVRDLKRQAEVLGEDFHASAAGLMFASIPPIAAAATNSVPVLREWMNSSVSKSSFDPSLCRSTASLAIVRPTPRRRPRA